MYALPEDIDEIRSSNDRRVTKRRNTHDQSHIEPPEQREQRGELYITQTNTVKGENEQRSAKRESIARF